MENARQKQYKRLAAGFSQSHSGQIIIALGLSESTFEFKASDK